MDNCFHLNVESIPSRSMDEAELHIRTPFTCIASAVSNGDKSTFIVDFLFKSRKFIDNPISRVILVSKHYQKLHKKLREDFEICYANTFVEAESFFSPNCCLIVDYFLDEINAPDEANRFVNEIFCSRCHHENINIIVLVQQLFPPHLRTIFNNASYLLIGKWIKNKSSIATLAKQFSPLNYKYFLEAYRHATKNPTIS